MLTIANSPANRRVVRYSEKVLFFMGLGCEALPNILNLEWHRQFRFIALKNMGVVEQAQLLVDQGVFPVDGVVVAHSAGSNVAICYTSIVNQMVDDDMLGENCRIGKVVLIAPPPLPGDFLPNYVIRLMLMHKGYWSKGLPWSKPFRLSHDYHQLLMVGDDISRKMQDVFERVSGLWFPRVVAANFTKRFNLAWKLREPIACTLRRQGVSATVFGGQSDLMIHASHAERVANKLGGEYIHVDHSHMGFMLGYDNLAFLEDLLAEIYDSDNLVMRS
jgi:pimeloyl-ACP methyl ester carboxylesterase